MATPVPNRRPNLKYGVILLIIGLVLIPVGYWEPQIVNGLQLSGMGLPVLAVAQNSGSGYVFQISVAQGVGQTCMIDNTQGTHYCTDSTTNVPVNIGDSVTFNFVAGTGYQFDRYYVNGGAGVIGTQNPVTATIVAQSNCGGAGQSFCNLSAYFVPIGSVGAQPAGLSTDQLFIIFVGIVVVVGAVIIIVL